MKLSILEKQSAVWLKLDAFMSEQIKSLRHQNDGELSAEATARLRGRIAQLKTILALGEDREPVQAGIDS